MLRSLLVGFALLAAAPAQLRTHNVEFSGSVEIIDWNGRPALLLVNVGRYPDSGGYVARFYPPLSSVYSWKFDVVAAVLLDARPCAVGARVTLAYENAYRNLLPPIYLPAWGSWIGAYTMPMRYEQNFMPTSWDWNYCLPLSCTTLPSCGPAVPQLNAVVVYPTLL